jgi:hypothetical protein
MPEPVRVLTAAGFEEMLSPGVGLSKQQPLNFPKFA